MKRLGVLLVLAMLAACNSPNSQSRIVPGALQHAAPQGHAGSYPITHVVIIVQENRSFDNFFRGFPKADSATFGYGHGTKYTLQELPLKWTFDLNHYHYQFLEDYDGGNNDGFDRLIRGTADGCKYVKNHDWVNHPSCWNFWTGKVYNKMAFSYVKKSDIQAYWTMASRYALGDHNFASTNGPSFGEHQQLIAGRTGHASEVPRKRRGAAMRPKRRSITSISGRRTRPSFRRTSATRSGAAIPASPIRPLRISSMRPTLRGVGTNNPIPRPRNMKTRSGSMPSTRLRRCGSGRITRTW